jgi:hypothetical protein
MGGGTVAFVLVVDPPYQKHTAQDTDVQQPTIPFHFIALHTVLSYTL